MSMSRQFASIGLPPRTKKRKNPPQAVNVKVSAAPAAKKSRSSTGAQIPRGFVTALAADSKYFDTAVASYQFNEDVGVVKHLDVVPQGDSVSQRNGKSWQNTNLQIRGKIIAGTAGTVSHIAMFIVWDRQPNKALAAVTDIFDAVPSSSLSKRENKGRFLVIKKWERILTGNSTTPATGREGIVIDKWIRLPAECIAQATAADTTGAIGNRVTGALLAVFMGDDPSGSPTLCPNGAFTFRVGFKDPGN